MPSKKCQVRSVTQECQVRSVKQECLTRVLRNSVKQGCPTRVSPQCVNSGCLPSRFAGKCEAVPHIRVGIRVRGLHLVSNSEKFKQIETLFASRFP